MEPEFPCRTTYRMATHLRAAGDTSATAWGCGSANAMPPAWRGVVAGSVSEPGRKQAESGEKLLSES